MAWFSRREFGQQAELAKAQPTPLPGAMKLRPFWRGASLIACAVVLTFVASWVLRDQTPSSPPDTSSPVAAVTAVVVTTPEQGPLREWPAAESAMTELYGESMKAAVPPKFWFSQVISDGGKETLVVFGTQAQLDERGNAKICHACAVQSGVISYEHLPDGWHIESAQRDLGEVGSFGNPPKTKVAQVLKVRPGHFLLAIEERSMAQGEEGVRKWLVDHNGSAWSAVGDLFVGGSNVCNQETQRSGTTSGCYRFSSSFSFLLGKGLEYPDILVSRKGTMYDTQTDRVVIAGQARYRFDGTNYEPYPSATTAIRLPDEDDAAGKLGRRKVDTPSLLQAEINRAPPEKWVKVYAQAGSSDEVYVDLGNVRLNGNGNRVALSRLITIGRRAIIEDVNEYDCENHRVHSLGGVGKWDGRMVSATGEDKYWFTHDTLFGLEMVCAARLQTE